MPAKRVNVLVYAGAGSTTPSVSHATWSLRRLLGPHYAIVTVTADQILKEPWQASCALLVMPGGADMGYCRTLNGEGNRRIKQYVQSGGCYLGLCAGGYYGCARCEWEVGKKGMEVVGDRELAFFPGICRGLAFPGFVYHEEKGTRAAKLTVNRESLKSPKQELPEHVTTYYNGGGVFVDAEKYADRGVQVLAKYAEELAVEGGESKAAVVYCKVGDGAAVLTGPHPEYVFKLMQKLLCHLMLTVIRFSGTNLNPSEPTGHSNYAEVVKALIEDEEHRVRFMKACLAKLGLETSNESHSVPSLSRMHLTSSETGMVSEVVHGWQEAGIVTKDDDGHEVIKGENDKFVLESEGGNFDMSNVDDALPDRPTATQGNGDEGIIDYNALPKRLYLHETNLPSSRETPHFNHHAFYSNLKTYHSQQRDSARRFGQNLIYGEVVTSTSTLLEKNPTLLSHLPIGTTATATTQVAGRGRGTNVWVSPPGSLMFSTMLKHSLALSNTAPVVFVQYLAALAIVAGIHGYDKGYEKMPVKLKWPNDIYALDPTVPEREKKYVKIGGILVNSSYAGGDYTLVTGIGLNVSNSLPTTSLSQLAAKLKLQTLTLEKLLASILAQFEALYTRFCRTGFDKQFEDTYYRSWLHSDQIVTLETEGGVRARVKGITTDWGLLVAEELGWEDRPTGKRWQLQSDSNSFDFFKGLVKRKV